MIKAASDVRQRCYNHPHRRATRLCARCKRGMCDECARDQAHCDLCQQELADLHDLINIPVKERVRRASISLRNFLIGLGILALLAIPASYVVRSLMSTPITPEEFARFRYAAAGTFETPEGVNVLSTVLGARAHSASSAQEGYAEKRLIDEYSGPGFPGWRSEGRAFPHEVIFEPQQLTRFEKVVLTQQINEPEDTFIRDFEVQVATAAPEGPYRTIGRWTLDQHLEPQRFEFPPAEARWIKLVALTNYGGPYASLAEFNAYILPRNPFAPPLETPLPPPRR